MSFELLNRYEELSKKINNISIIKPGQRWSTTYQRAEYPSMMSRIYRTLNYDECREFNLEDIRTTISNAYYLAQELKTNNREDLAARLCSEMLNCCYGINNLKTIYHDSNPTKNDIDHIINDIVRNFGSV